MMNAQFDLPLLQRLLFGAEIVDIRVGDIVGLAKEAVITLGLFVCADDALGEIIQLLVGVAHQPGIENVVVVSAAVEAHQPELHQLLNFLGCRVNHPHNRLVAPLNLPVHQEEIGEYLHIVKYQFCIVILDRRGWFGGLERHFVYQLDAVVRVIGAVGRKRQDSVAHIGDIIGQAAFISVRQNFVDEIDAGLSSRMDLFIEVALDLNSKPFLALHRFGIYHLAFSFQWQARADCRDG